MWREILGILAKATVIAVTREASGSPRTFVCNFEQTPWVPRAQTDSMTASQFATELKACGLRMVRNRIISEDCPGVTWKPVTTGGQIDWARTLRRAIRERRDEIVRQVRIGAA
jgi:hypothetical protein